MNKQHPKDTSFMVKANNRAYKDAMKMVKAGYKETAFAWTWDNPVRRIANEKGITLYADQQFSDWNHNASTYPAYKYKVTFELVEVVPSRWNKKIYSDFSKLKLQVEG
jgi:hypothetical protein